MQGAWGVCALSALVMYSGVNFNYDNQQGYFENYHTALLAALARTNMKSVLSCDKST